MKNIDPAEIPLRDIHLPEPISWWPLAPGWWVLVAVLLTLLVLGGLLWFFFSKRHLRRATRALEQIETRYQQHQDAHEFARDCSMWARQFAFLQQTNGDASNSIGSDWVDYWVARMPTSVVSEDELRHALTVAPYRKEAKVDPENLTLALRNAIKQQPSNRQFTKREAAA